MNIFDYLKWRGDVPFAISPFNDVDNLILAELAYTDFGGIVPEDGTAVPLADACEAYFREHGRPADRPDRPRTARAPRLMDDMYCGTRFADTKLAFYRSERDAKANLQFSAVTFLLADGTAYAAFRGTDGTVVGWKEDFILSYTSGTESQQRAAEYLSGAGKVLDCPLRAGGHSKGGNLAVYAAACCDETIRERIISVYTNDGPGFRPEMIASEGYRQILPRIVSIIPDTSVFGLLMDSLTVPKVIQSTASGIAQHDGFTWETERDRFVPAELSETGKLVSKTLSGWLEQTDDKSRKALTETVFGLLEATGKETLRDIKGSGLISVGTMVMSTPDLPKGSLSVIGRLVSRLGLSGIKTAASSYLQDLTGKNRQDEDGTGKQKPGEEKEKTEE